MKKVVPADGERHRERVETPLGLTDFPLALAIMTPPRLPANHLSAVQGALLATTVL